MKFAQEIISVNISVFGVLYRYRCTDGGEICRGGGDIGSNFTAIGATYLILAKTKSASEQFVYRRFVPRAMLPAIMIFKGEPFAHSSRR